LASKTLLKEGFVGIEGDCLEICPDAISMAQVIGMRVQNNGGASLLIDYGEDNPLQQSLRAIKNHQFQNVLESPGTADISALVDFSAIKKGIGQVSTAKSYGTVTQAHFLKSLGIDTRLDMLTKKATPKEKTNLLISYDRLLNEKKMGSVYKVLSIVNSNLDPPVGFERIQEKIESN